MTLTTMTALWLIATMAYLAIYLRDMSRAIQARDQLMGRQNRITTYREMKRQTIIAESGFAKKIRK